MSYVRDRPTSFQHSWQKFTFCKGLQYCNKIAIEVTFPFMTENGWFVYLYLFVTIKRQKLGPMKLKNIVDIFFLFLQKPRYISQASGFSYWPLAMVLSLRLQIWTLWHFTLTWFSSLEDLIRLFLLLTSLPFSIVQRKYLCLNC